MHRFFWAAPGIALALSACIEGAPSKVELTPAGEKVEVVGEPPNPDIYKAVGEVRGEAIGTSTEAQQYARRALRNEAAQRGANFVAVEEVTARVARDMSGRTVVSIIGQAYKPKE